MPKPICNILDTQTGDRCQNELPMFWPFCEHHKAEWAELSGRAEDQGLGRIDEHEWATLMRGPH